MASALRFLFNPGHSRSSVNIFKEIGFNFLASEKVCLFLDLVISEKQSFVVKILVRVVVAK